jgi:hypothetical protein
MLGRDDQASSPLIDMLGGEQHGHPGHQCIATWLCEANQQQPCVSPRPETPHIREIQILRDQKAVSRLCCLPDLIVVALPSVQSALYRHHAQAPGGWTPGARADSRQVLMFTEWATQLLGDLLGPTCQQTQSQPDVFVTQCGEVSQNLRRGGAFGQTGKDRPQRYSCALEHWFAADNFVGRARCVRDSLWPHPVYRFHLRLTPVSNLIKRPQVPPWIELNSGDWQLELPVVPGDHWRVAVRSPMSYTGLQ